MVINIDFRQLLTILTNCYTNITDSKPREATRSTRREIQRGHTRPDRQAIFGD